MLGDELNTPLGLEANEPAPRHGRLRRRMILGAAAVALVAVGAFILTGGDGHGGEPYVRVAIERPPPAAAPAAPVSPVVAATPAPAQTPAAPLDMTTTASIEAQSGVKIVRGGSGQAPGALIIQLPEPVGIHLTPAPDKRLLEKGKYGPLPKIGADGARPVDVYARPLFDSSKLPAGAPRIVLVVGGLGLSADLTQSAVDKLPAAVTLAFAPYGNDLDPQAHAAREAGHEIVLQVPMEPFDSSDPGPHTLLTSNDADHNIDRLHWFMGRFTGYVGIANFLGGKFTSNETAFAPILHEVASRGLLYLDDGSSPQSLTANLVGAAGTPWAQSDVVIDAVQTPEAVDAALAKLETIARQKGLAIGVGSDLPVTLDAVNRFATGLEARGVALVPLSASMHQPTLAARNDPPPSP